MPESRRCPECGAQLPPDASPDMCPKCLMGAALADSASAAGPAPPDESQIEETIDSDANLAGPSRSRVSPRLDAGRGETGLGVDQTLDSAVADASPSPERLRRGAKVKYFGDYEILEGLVEIDFIRKAGSPKISGIEVYGTP